MGEGLLLELENLTKVYEAPDGVEGVVVLRGVSLCVSAGEALAVTGPSGSGKSTLLNIMGGLDRPTSGRVILGGRDLGGLSDGELSKVRNGEIGFVFQLHHLLPQCTLLENVLLPTLAGGGGDGGEVEERAMRLLRRVGLTERADYRPGLVSGGERQRAAVVRALINKPKVLLADEPTGSLDHAAAGNLAQLLRELNEEEGVTLIVVTHSNELAATLPRTLALGDGKLTEAGQTR